MGVQQVVVRATTSNAIAALRERVPDLGPEHNTWTGKCAESGYYLVPLSLRELVLTIVGVAEVKRAINLSCCVNP